MARFCFLCGKETFKDSRKYCNDCAEEKEKLYRRASYEKKKGKRVNFVEE